MAKIGIVLALLFSLVSAGQLASATIQPVQIWHSTITAYSASIEETDDFPRIAANNREVFEGGIANNCLPFGTQVEINGEYFIVNDRMNRRYDCFHFDIFIDSKPEAQMFGRWDHQRVAVYN